MKKVFFVLLFLFFLFHLLFRIYSYRSEYVSKFDSKYWTSRYLKSQWVIPNSKQSIGDDGLYAYIGWEFMQGHDPTTLSAEVPPFGKYLIGLSIVIFHNQNIFALIIGLLALISFYILNIQLFKNIYIAFLPVFFFSLEPLFYLQLRAPYIDLLYLSCLLLTFIFVLRRQVFMTHVFIGLFIATKSTIPSFIMLFLSVVLYLFITKQRNVLKRFILFSPFSFIVLTATYFRFFLLGHSFRQFLGVQKYIYHFYSTGVEAQLGMIYPLVFLGKWYTWWGKIIHVDEWMISWPVTFILTIISIIYSRLKKQQFAFMLLIVWLLVYSIFLSIIPVWPRYLLLVLPFFYTLSLWFFVLKFPKLFKIKQIK